MGRAGRDETFEAGSAAENADSDNMREPIESYEWICRSLRALTTTGMDPRCRHNGRVFSHSWSWQGHLKPFRIRALLVLEFVKTRRMSMTVLAQKRHVKLS